MKLELLWKNGHQINLKKPSNHRLELTKSAVTAFASSSWSVVSNRKRRAGCTLAASASQARLRAAFAAQPGVNRTEINALAY
jgi:hypothetical protein